MRSLRIAQSVGINGKNSATDIKAAQSAINQLIHLIPPTKKLKVDGKLGFKPEQSKTVNAIQVFQKKIVGIFQPDGRIDVRGKTHKKIDQKLLSIPQNVALPLSETFKAELRNKLEQYEGRVEHMYLDTKGFVTVGIGHMLPSAEIAKDITFVNKLTGAVATKKEIEDEFALIKSKAYGAAYPARRFKSSTQLKITDSTINQLTNKHIASFESELKIIYGANEFSAYPENVKMALFDMIFNLGMSKLKSGYPKFNKYIKAKDYKNAAMESHRNGISAQRNQYVKDLLSK